MAKFLLTLLLISVGGVFSDLNIKTEHICFKNRCFMFNRYKQTWSGAQKDCQDEGARLVVFNDAATVSQVFRYINDKVDGFWTGERIYHNKTGRDTTNRIHGILNGNIESGDFGTCIQLKNKRKITIHPCSGILHCYTLENRQTFVRTDCKQKAYYICEKAVQITEENSKDSQPKVPDGRTDNPKNEQINAGDGYNRLGDGAVVGIVFIICLTIVAAIVIVGLILKIIRREDSNSLLNSSLSGENRQRNTLPSVAEHVTNLLSSFNPHSSDTGNSVNGGSPVDNLQSPNCSSVKRVVPDGMSQSPGNRSSMNSEYQSMGDLKTPVEESKMVF